VKGRLCQLQMQQLNHPLTCSDPSLVVDETPLPPRPRRVVRFRENNENSSQSERALEVPQYHDIEQGGWTRPVHQFQFGTLTNPVNPTTNTSRDNVSRDSTSRENTSREDSSRDNTSRDTVDIPPTSQGPRRLR